MLLPCERNRELCFYHQYVVVWFTRSNWQCQKRRNQVSKLSDLYSQMYRSISYTKTWWVRWPLSEDTCTVIHDQRFRSEVVPNGANSSATFNHRRPYYPQRELSIPHLLRPGSSVHTNHFLFLVCARIKGGYILKWDCSLHFLQTKSRLSHFLLIPFMCWKKN